MPFRWHVHLPGPVAYSRPMRKKRGSSGPLTALVVWFIVKPLELTARGLVKLFTVRPRSNTEQTPVLDTRIIGWRYTQWGWLYWNGQNWYDLDGRPLF